MMPTITDIKRRPRPMDAAAMKLRGTPNDSLPTWISEGNKVIAKISGFNSLVNRVATTTMKVIGISTSRSACLRDRPMLNLQ